MKSLLKTVAKAIDSFSERRGLRRFAAIVGGEAIINLFLIMDDEEKGKAWELARRLKRDKNLSAILARGRRAERIKEDELLDTF